MNLIGVCDLPEELRIRIFENLDGQNLVACSLVCRIFHTTIRDACILQYIKELSIAGLSDRGGSSLLTIADRLSELRAFQRSQATLTFRKRMTHTMPPNNFWELFGGFLASGVGGTDDARGLLFVELPSSSRDAPINTWMHSDMGVQIRDFTMDPTQDLVVIIGHPREGVYMIHLKTMSTGGAHPHATNAALSCVPDNIRSCDFVIQVMDEFLAVLFHTFDRRAIDQLYIWNWRTGKCVSELKASLPTNTIIDSFSFLSPRHFVVPRFQTYQQRPTTPYLEIYDFISRNPWEPVTSLTPTLVRRFEFPTVVDYGLVLAMLARSDPPPRGPALSSDSQIPFRTADTSRVLAVSLEIIRHRQQVCTYMLFVHHSALLEGIEDGSIPELLDKRVPWDKWGYGKSRMLQTLYNENSWVCYIHGTRYVRLEPRNELPALRIRMLDFNPLALRRRDTPDHNDDDDGAKAYEDEVYSASHATLIPAADVFERDVVTTLPYRDVLSREVYRYNAIMIDEECLVGLSPGEVGHMEGVEFLCF